MNWCNCATSFAECKRCGLKCYPTPDSIQKLKADLTREREAARVLEEALDRIYQMESGETLGQICKDALAKADEIRGGE